MTKRRRTTKPTVRDLVGPDTQPYIDFLESLDGLSKEDFERRMQEAFNDLDEAGPCWGGCVKPGLHEPARPEVAYAYGHEPAS
jgi:hypothetical protein